METIRIDFDQKGNYIKALRGKYNIKVGERIEITKFHNGSYAARWFYGEIIQKTMTFSWIEGKMPTINRYTYVIESGRSQPEKDIRTIDKICKQIPGILAIDEVLTA